MDTLDQISRRRQQLADRLDALDKKRAALDEQRSTLIAAISDCDAAERVLHAISPDSQQPPSASIDRTSRVSITKLVLDAVAAHPNGARLDQLRAYISEKYGENVKQTSLATTLQRHKAADRVINRDGMWFPADSESATSGGDAPEVKLDLMFH